MSFRSAAGAEEPAFLWSQYAAGGQQVPLRLRRFGMTKPLGAGIVSVRIAGDFVAAAAHQEIQVRAQMRLLHVLDV